jgi:iron-sulfur cluster repair protein YtfE (RIC family)
MRATELLRRDHAHVREMFAALEETAAASGEARQQLLDRIAEELEIHTKIEEEIFYPAVQKVSGRIQHAREEHERVASLLGDVEGRDPASAEFMAGVRELKTAVMRHVAEEEGPIFEEAARLGDDELTRLGERLAERKEAAKTSLLQRGVRAVKRAVRKIA